jgi:peptide/nickel transport system substrate-binding protein
MGRVNADTNRRIFSALTQYDDAINLVGDLAEEWAVSSDRKTFTFRLRKGVKWHDGAPFTSKDVAFTFARHAHPAAQGGYSNLLDTVVGVDELRGGKAETISGVKTPDDLTLVVELKAPLSAFPANMSKIYIVPEHRLGKASPEAFPKDPFWSTLPIGTGPYKLTKYVPQQSLEYERHVDFHFGKPKIEKMVWTLIPDSATHLLAIEKGEIDYTNAISGAENMARAKKNESLFIMTNAEPRSPQISPHCQVFTDKRVRQAMCHAINRKALIEITGDPDFYVPNEYFFMPKWVSEGALKFSDLYPHDPKKARALLEEAKWDFNREIEYMIGGNAPSPESLLIQEQLQAAGFKVKLRLVPQTSPYMYGEAKYDLVSVGMAYDDPYNVAQSYTCRTTGPGGTSLSQYCSPEFDKLMAEESMAANQQERAVLYKKMNEVLLRDAAAVLTIYGPNRAVFRKRVHVPRWAWYAFDYSWEWWLD